MRHLRMLGILGVVGAMLCVSACADATVSDTPDGVGTTPPTESPWAPVTHTYDPECARCVSLGTVELDHMGEVTLLADPLLDDEETQWIQCVQGFLTCVDQGTDKDVCVADSVCPQPCKADYQALVDADADDSRLAAQWRAFEGVFMEPDGRCAPVGIVPVAPEPLPEEETP